MDKIQAFLITAGQKELAQEYFEKFSSYNDLSQEQKDEIDMGGQRAGLWVAEKGHQIDQNLIYFDEFLESLPNVKIGETNRICNIRNQKDKKVLELHPLFYVDKNSSYNWLSATRIGPTEYSPSELSANYEKNFIEACETVFNDNTDEMPHDWKNDWEDIKNSREWDSVGKSLLGKSFDSCNELYGKIIEKK